MQFSAAGIELLKRSEGFVDHPYLDTGGLFTIGYGHRIIGNIPGRYVLGIDEATAGRILADDVEAAEDAVARLVKVTLSQGQFDALVDFTFNLGSGRLSGSTLLKKLNAGDYDGAAQQLLAWDHGEVAGKMQELAGLKARREAEFNLWKGVAA